LIFHLNQQFLKNLTLQNYIIFALLKIKKSIETEILRIEIIELASLFMSVIFNVGLLISIQQ